MATPHAAAADSSTANGSHAVSIAMSPKPSSGARSFTPGTSNASARAIGIATSVAAYITDLTVRITPWRPMSWAIRAGTT